MSGLPPAGCKQLKKANSHSDVIAGRLPTHCLLLTAFPEVVKVKRRECEIDGISKQSNTAFRRISLDLCR